MKIATAAALMGMTMFATAAMAQELPNLEGKEVVVVTENAYPPLQFLDKSGAAVGWEYDAMAEIAKRINITVKYENTSWDAMIPAVSEGQFDLGMTGITIKDERKEKVDFSEPYMRSEMLMIVRGDEARFTDAASFAAIPELLVSAQPGTSPFYAAIYNILDGNEENPRVIKFETFGAGLEALKAGEDHRRAFGLGRLRLHLPERVRACRADQRRDCLDEGGWHDGCAEPEVVRRIQDGRMIL